MIDGKDVLERIDKRIPCPACRGKQVEGIGPSYVQDGVEFMYDAVPCSVCGGVGEVCVCPVCEGSKVREGASCPVCDARGWVKVSEWGEAVDEGHRRLMEEHTQDEKDKAGQVGDGIVGLVAVHRVAMNAVTAEWERYCRKHEMHTVDAGAFGRVLGGMTVEYIKQMEEELGIGRHQVFARFVNGLLEYMETRGDAKGVGVVAGQAGECQLGMRAMGERVKVKKEDMN